MFEEYRPLHINNVLRELNNSSFAASFGDVKLVFANGEVTHHFIVSPSLLFLPPPFSLHPPSTQVIPYFKSLLSIISVDWKFLLQLRPDSEVNISLKV